jgi:hypothetical protein
MRPGATDYVKEEVIEPFDGKGNQLLLISVVAWRI